MNKLFTLLLLSALTNLAMAQSTSSAQPYGKVDQADLEMKQCDFEKDANAEVLFDVASVEPEGMGRHEILVMERHTRTKIFNDFGKYMANVRITYTSYMEGVAVNGLEAETINFVDGKAEVTPLDKKLVYIEQIDKFRSAMVFTFPNVKPGSIIDYKYRVAGLSFPTWNFQNYVPTRYSEIKVNIPSYINFKSVPHVRQPYLKTVGEGTDAYQFRSMANLHSMPLERYMGSRDDNLERIEYIYINTNISTWPKIGELMAKYNAFGPDLNANLSNESAIIDKAKLLKSDDEKIAFVFDTIKNSIKWNDRLSFFAVDGIRDAWNKKIGNSAEINMLVYHFLKKVGIKADPLVVCTKNNGKINPANPTLNLFNNTVIYVPIDSTKNYILDATNKSNLYNTIPENILNTFGLDIDLHNALSVSYGDNLKAYNMTFIADDQPAMQSLYTNAEIKPEGKIVGDMEITSASYNKISALKLYQAAGSEENYIDSLRHKDNNFKISAFKRENVAVDSLPLVEKFNFDLDMNGSDANYIYFNPNSYNFIGANPFLNADRYSDVDFGYLNNYSVYSIYKLPAGFKADALPKSITLVMPDQSIFFKRIIAVDDGQIMVKYVLNHKKTIYFKEDYPDLREFYKKMYDLLAEQIVLKKI